jgi:hypothetical protein
MLYLILEVGVADGLQSMYAAETGMTVIAVEPSDAVQCSKMVQYTV